MTSHTSWVLENRKVHLHNCSSVFLRPSNLRCPWTLIHKHTCKNGYTACCTQITTANADGARMKLKQELPIYNADVPSSQELMVERLLPVRLHEHTFARHRCNYTGALSASRITYRLLWICRCRGCSRLAGIGWRRQFVEMYGLEETDSEKGLSASARTWRVILIINSISTVSWTVLWGQHKRLDLCTKRYLMVEDKPEQRTEGKRALVYDRRSKRLRMSDVTSGCKRCCDIKNCGRPSAKVCYIKVGQPFSIVEATKNAAGYLRANLGDIARLRQPVGPKHLASIQRRNCSSWRRLSVQHAQ